MTTESIKNIAIALAIVLIGYLGYTTFSSKKESERLHTELIGQTEKYVQLSEHAAKLENKYVDQETLKKELEAKFGAEKEALVGRIKVLSNATFVIREAARNSGKSDFSYQGEGVKYIVNEIRYANGGPPVGYVLIFDDGRVVSKLYNSRLDVATAISRDEESGRYAIVSKADYTLKSPSINLNGEKNWVNTPYPLKINGGSAFIDPTEPNQLVKHWMLWDPHLNANFNYDGKVRPGLGISLAGYGYTKNDLDFRILEIGAQYADERIEPTLIPISWRPFSGFLSNTYLGPGIMMRDSSIGYFLGLQFGL